MAESKDLDPIRDEITSGASPRTDQPTGSLGPQPDVAVRPSGSSFGEYELMEEIGSGGMGLVYKARQGKANRMVALKLIRAGTLASPQERERFRIEGESVALLDHPNIVPIFAVGEFGGQPFHSMKLIEGGTLARPKGGKTALGASNSVPCAAREPIDAAKLVASIAGAVHHAHQRGILHRDLKPSNILIDLNGTPYVADFGLAKWIGPGHIESTLTETGAVLGTASYMSPEQASGRSRELTTATDVYGLGAIFYELLTGRPPFRGATHAEILRKVIESEPDRPSVARGSPIDRDLETIALKCLEKEQGRRYGTAEALARDLERYLNHEPIEGRSTTTWGRFRKWVRRRPAEAALFGVSVSALVIFVGLLLGFTWRLRRALADEQQQRDLAVAGLYIADMDLAQKALDGAKFERALQLLDKHTPAPGARPEARDLRGFEWSYLLRKCRSQYIVLPELMNFVSSIAFSADGRWVATVGASPSGHLDDYHPEDVRIWDAATGRLDRSIPSKGLPAFGVAFDPDGSRVAISLINGEVRIVDLVGRKEFTLPPAVVGMCYEVEFSPDGRTLAVAYGHLFTLGFRRADANSVVALWDTRDWSSRILRGHVDSVTSLSFRNDGREVASAGRDGTAKLWDVATGNCRLTFRGHSACVFSVAFSPDGSRVVSTGEDKSVRVWDARTGTEVFNLQGHTNWGRAVAWSPDGKWIASAAFDATLILWDAAAGRPRQTFVTATINGQSLAFSPDSRRVASSFQNKKVLIRELFARSYTRTLTGAEGGLTTLAFMPDGGEVVASGHDHRVRAWPTEADRPVRVVGEHAIDVNKLAIAADGSTIAAAGADGAIRLWDARTGQAGLTLNGDSTILLAVAISPDGKRIASGGGNGTVKIWRLPSGELLHTMAGPSVAVFDVAFSPDGSKLATACGDGTTRIYNSATGSTVAELAGHTDFVYGVAFSPDGSKLATAGGDKTLRLWDAKSGRTIHTLLGHTDAVLGVAFSPDGRRVASAGRDRTVKLWDVEGGQETLELAEHDDAVTAVAFSADGRWLAAAGRDKTVKVWEALASPATPEQAKTAWSRGE